MARMEPPADKRNAPLFDLVDDPKGICSAIPEDHEGDAGEYFITRVQEIRWELWGLTVDLDAIEGMTDATSMLMSQVIDLLGVVTRSEALWQDSSDESFDAVRKLFSRSLG
jgi:hypothetical protein